MGHFSMEISGPSGLVLSEDQQSAPTIPSLCVIQLRRFDRCAPRPGQTDQTAEMGELTKGLRLRGTTDFRVTRR